MFLMSPGCYHCIIYVQEADCHHRWICRWQIRHCLTPYRLCPILNFIWYGDRADHFGWARPAAVRCRKIYPINYHHDLHLISLISLLAYFSVTCWTRVHGADICQSISKCIFCKIIYITYVYVCRCCVCMWFYRVSYCDVNVLIARRMRRVIYDVIQYFYPPSTARLWKQYIHCKSLLLNCCTFRLGRSVQNDLNSTQ